MEAKAKMILSIFVFSMMYRFVVGLGEEIELRSGDRPMFCAAIISQCKYRCEQREARGLGVEYVQMNIHIRNEAVKCELFETTVNEIVSADPPSNDKNEIVFNVPCCQQKPIVKEIIPAETITPLKPYPTTTYAAPIEKKENISTNLFLNNPLRDTTLSKPFRENPIPEDNNAGNQWDNLRLNLIFGFIVLLLLLVIIILILMFCKMSKTKKLQSSPEKSDFDLEATKPLSKEGQPVTQNGDVGRKRAIEVLAQTVQNIEPPPVVVASNELTGENKEDNTVPNFQPTDDLTGRDYVVLEPVQTSPPPKSAHSRSRGQSAAKSEEVLIIGGGRSNQAIKYQHQHSDEVKPSSNFEIMQDFGQRGDFTQVVASTAPRPQQGVGSKSKQELFKERRADSLPENGTRRDVEYDKVAPDIVSASLPPVPDYNSYMNKTRAVSHHTPFGTSSLDRIKLQQQANVYNVLRGETQHECAGDYQHLSRSERANPNGSSLKEINETPAKPIQISDDGYVQDFQIQKKRQSPDGKEQRKASYKADGESDKDEAYDSVTAVNGGPNSGVENTIKPTNSQTKKDRTTGYVNGVLRTEGRNTKEYEPKSIKFPESVDL